VGTATAGAKGILAIGAANANSFFVPKAQRLQRNTKQNRQFPGSKNNLLFPRLETSSSFRSQAMHPPPPEHWPPSEGRDWRGRKLMEEIMRVLTLTELMRLSKIELCDLLARITNALPDFPEGSVERANALLNLSNVRRVLARRDFSP
jgi:hypothetical protein